jgi:Fic family protein
MFLPKYTITNPLVNKLENIAQLKAKIESSLVNVSWLPKLVRETITRLVHSSTAIEGNTLTLKEVEILGDGKSLPHKSQKEKQEVINHFKVINYIIKRSKIKKFTEKEIFELHKIIGENEALDRGPVGQYRNYQVYVGDYRPPKAGQVESMMKDLIEWSEKEGSALSPVISSALMHYQFETIHPFGDGNGRVGRALAIWELYRKGFDTKHVFSIDEIYNKNRANYYRLLNTNQRQGSKADLTGWIEFVSEAVEWSMENTWERISKIKINTKSNINFELTQNQEKLLNLLQHGAMNIQEITKELKVTKAGAHFILKPLIKAKLIERRGGHKSGRYYLL